MLLEELKLIEAAATGISFEHHVLQSGQGQIKIEYGEIEFEGGNSLVNDESKSTLHVKVAPSITGYREDAEGADFILKINMRLLYVYPSNQELTEEFLQKNSWYFGSFIRTYFKFYADGILSNTTLQGIQLAYN
ncbi:MULTISPECIES: hypothetical protein [unclassified Pantoea]|uniref:hypothetical protein n=1 Tax=unclassified Pantoea TaxID=2630326 RepID=UPI002269E854|nr:MULTISPECIES: hypothetical protein [unclassified Pantoea]